MKRSLRSCAFVVGCLSAFALGSGMALAAEDPDVDAASETLPVSLNSWGAEPDGLPFLTPSFAAQQRMAVQPPFIAWDHTEIGGYVGVVKYSPDFKGSTDIIGGLTVRVPVPGIPGDWGVWANLSIGGLSRDMPSFYPHTSGTWFGGTIGADYLFVDGQYFRLRAQAGLTYNYWNHIQSLDNNFAGTVGADMGFYWIKFNPKSTVSLTPQFTFCGSNWYATLTVGIQADF